MRSLVAVLALLMLWSSWRVSIRALALTLLLALPASAQAFVPTAPARAKYFDFCVAGTPGAVTVLGDGFLAPEGSRVTKCYVYHPMDLAAIPTRPICRTRQLGSDPPSVAAGGLAGLDLAGDVANPYPSGSVDAGLWERERSNCEAIVRRWGRQSAVIGGTQGGADGYDCPSNEAEGISRRALAAYLGREATWLELIDFLATCKTDGLAISLLQAELKKGGDGGGDPSCQPSPWRCEPMPPEVRAGCLDGSLHCTSQGVSLPLCWQPRGTAVRGKPVILYARGVGGCDPRVPVVQPPPPPPPPPPPELDCDGGQPDGACTDRERAAGTCEEDCPVDPEVCEECSPPGWLPALIRQIEEMLDLLRSWAPEPGPASTGVVDVVLLVNGEAVSS
jgi:hypothetical protein